MFGERETKKKVKWKKTENMGIKNYLENFVIEVTGQPHLVNLQEFLTHLVHFSIKTKQN